MKGRTLKDRSNRRDCPGVVLLVTLVLLVVLSTLGYTLSSRIAAQRHRDCYIIDYQAARYGCDSAVKYAFATLEEITPRLISRPNEPDFSDLFSFSEAEYEEFLDEWANEAVFDMNKSFSDINDINAIGDVNDANYTIGDEAGVPDFNEPNSLRVRGPYGPAWPFVAEPVELKIGAATVKIEIEDENAKYPIGWALLDDDNVRREAMAGLQTFCEWMDVNDVQIDALKRELKEISEIKSFKLKFKSIKPPISKSKRRRGRRGSQKRPAKNIPASVHTADFAKLFHSSLIDTEALARPTVISEDRKESALKYMGMWGSSKVNINSAPRHVLEAAFVFGGDEVNIAEEIIQRRRIKPFKDVEDLKKSLFRYSDSIEKCKEYITTVSNFFTIRVTTVCGVAKALAIIAVTKDKGRVKRIAVISG